jgi:hypothetical protein
MAAYIGLKAFAVLVAFLVRCNAVNVTNSTGQYGLPFKDFVS